MVKSRYPVLAFDLDGTLIDSKPSIVHGVQQLWQQLGRASPAAHIVRQLIGRPLPDIFTHLGLGHAEEDYDSLRQIYSEHMFQHMQQHLRPFPGVLDVLSKLQGAGIPMAIVTSRGRDSVEPCLDLCGIEVDLFQVTVAREDSAVHKPSPVPLQLAAAKLGCHTADMLYVGDADVDILCAHAAGSGVAFAAYGADEDLHPTHRQLVHHHLHSFTDLLTAIRG